MRNVYNLSVKTSPASQSQFTSPRKASPSGQKYTPGPRTPISSANPSPTHQAHLPAKPHHYIRRLYDDTSCSESEVNPPASAAAPTLTESRRADRAKRRKAVGERQAKARRARDKIIKERMAKDEDLRKLKEEREALQRRIAELEAK